MAIVPFARIATASDQIRDTFAAAAYAGDLPRDLWIKAQNLVAQYDDAKNDVDRNTISNQMVDLSERRDELVDVGSMAA